MVKGKFIHAICALVTVVAASSFIATDCSTFEQFTQGAQYTTSCYDGNGKLTATIDCTCDAVTASGDKTTAEISAIMKDGEGKANDTTKYSMICAGGSYKMDLNAVAGAAASSNPQTKGMEMVIEGDMLEYPSGMTAGQSLPGGDVVMKMSKDGRASGTLITHIKNRKCEMVESKTTSAGTWECYKISYTIDGVMDLGMMKIPMAPRNCVEWFSYKVGPVRTESYSGGKMDGYTELTKFMKPQ